MVPAFELKRQYTAIKEEVNAAIHRVFDSGNFILGREVAGFEEEFSKYCGARHGVGVGNGTDALHLGLLACGIGAGDEVITVSNTASATVLAISFCGARPVLVDIDPDTYTIDTSKIAAKITENTKAILPVHLFGHPANMDAIMETAERHGLRVIEDVCQGHGSEYKKKKSGSFGDVGCFSFYPTKNLGAYGDGGMVITNDSGIAEKLALLRNYGQKDRYKHILKGYNSRLDEIHAAILRAKLAHLDEWIAKRRHIARLYCELLEGNGKVSLPLEKGPVKHSYHLFVVRCGKRDALQKWLASKDICTNIHYPTPVHMQEAYAELNCLKGTLPLTEKYANDILSIPIFPELTEEEVKKVADAILKMP